MSTGFHWVSAGPVVSCISSGGTLFLFNGKVEGVAKLVNPGGALGFATMQNSTGTLPDRTVPIVNNASLFVAFGALQTHLKITGSEIDITPGYALKDKEQQDLS